MNTPQEELYQKFAQYSEHELRQIMNSPFHSREEQQAAAAVLTDRGIHKGSNTSRSTPSYADWIGHPEEAAFIPIVFGLGVFGCNLLGGILLGSTFLWDILRVGVILLPVVGMIYLTRDLPNSTYRIVWAVAAFFLGGLIPITFGIMQASAGR